MKIKDWLKRCWRSVQQFYYNHFEMYLEICEANEHVYIGRRLWQAIEKDMTPEDKAEIRIWFKKYPVCMCGGCRNEYVMHINPDLSGYKTPKGEEPFTATLQFNVFGHIGFQSVQPTPAEIAYEYGIECEFNDRVKIRVLPVMINGEKAFVLTDEVIGITHTSYLEDQNKEVELDELIRQ